MGREGAFEERLTRSKQMMRFEEDENGAAIDMKMEEANDHIPTT